MKENLKIGLLAVIAVTMIVDVFMDSDEDGTSSNSANKKVESNVAAQPANNDNIKQLDPTGNKGQDQNKPAKPQLPPTTISFEEEEHDFGEIKQNTQNEKIFSFKNTGDKPLLIQNAKGSCGCTVPEYPKEPIPPGQESEIKVVYSPGEQKNQQTKTVTITANTEPKTTILRIKANVIPEG